MNHSNYRIFSVQDPSPIGVELQFQHVVSPPVPLTWLAVLQDFVLIKPDPDQDIVNHCQHVSRLTRPEPPSRIAHTIQFPPSFSYSVSPISSGRFALLLSCLTRVVDLRTLAKSKVTPDLPLSARLRGVRGRNQPSIPSKCERLGKPRLLASHKLLCNCNDGCVQTLFTRAWQDVDPVTGQWYI